MGSLRKPTYHLTFDDAVTVWLRHWRREKQQDTAALFGVNQGRISEVINGTRQPGSREAALLARSGQEVA